MIGERFRRVFDPDDTGYITQDSFTKVMREACLGLVKDKIYIVFQMLDFDNDGYVSKDDVSALLLHVPVYSRYVDTHVAAPTPQTELTARQKYKDSVSDMLHDCYKDDYFTFKDFEHITLTQASDIFVTIFYILLTRFPTLSELYMGSLNESDSTVSNTISIKKNSFPPAHRMPELWPIQELYSKKDKIEMSLKKVESIAKSREDEENIPEDNDEDSIKIVISNTFNSNDIKKKENMLHSQKTQKEIAVGFLQFNINVFHSTTLNLNQDVCSEKSLLKKPMHSQSKSAAETKINKKIDTDPHIMVERFSLKKSDTIMECLQYEKDSIEGDLYEYNGLTMEPYYFVLKDKTLYSTTITQRNIKQSKKAQGFSTSEIATPT